MDTTKEGEMLMTNVLQVFITDDDAFFLSAISLVINAEKDMKISGQAVNGLEAIEKIENHQPDIVLMDIQMPKMNGIECLKRLKKKYPNLCILILTTFNEEEYIIEGLANGANGYFIKDMNYTLLIRTIRELKNGQYILPVEVATKLAKFSLKSFKNKSEHKLPKFIESNNKFTEKEQEILLLLMKRLTNKEMANELYLSVGTVRNYLTVIYDKLGVKNRQDAIVLLTRRED